MGLSMAVISKHLKRALASTVSDVRAVSRFLKTRPAAVTVYGTHRESLEAAIAQGHGVGAELAKRGAAVRTGAATAVMHSAPAGFNAERAGVTSAGNTNAPQEDCLLTRTADPKTALSPEIHADDLAKVNTFRFRELGLILDNVAPGAVVPGSVITRDGGLSTLSGALAHEIVWMQHGGAAKGLAVDPQWQPMVQTLYAGAKSAVSALQYTADPIEMATIALGGPVCKSGVNAQKLLKGIEAELIRGGLTALADDRTPPVVISGRRAGSNAATNAVLREVASIVAKRGGDLRLGMGGPMLGAVRKGVQGTDAQLRLIVDRDEKVPKGLDVRFIDHKPAQRQHTLLHGMKALVMVWPGDSDTIANVFHFITEARKHRRPAVPVVICGDLEGAKKAWQILADLREDRLGLGQIDKDQVTDPFYNVLF